LLAQAARVPPRKAWSTVVALDRDLRLPRQARHVRNSGRPATGAPTHEALLGRAVHTNKASLAFRVLRACRNRGLHSIGIVLVGLVRRQ